MKWQHRYCRNMDALSGIPGCETGGTMFVSSKPMGVSRTVYDMSGNAGMDK